MKITTTYLGTLNGMKGAWCGFIPKGAIIEETRNYLSTEEGFELIRKSTSQNVGNSIRLYSSDSQDNYEEVEVNNDNSK